MGRNFTGCVSLTIRKGIPFAIEAIHIHRQCYVEHHCNSIAEISPYLDILQFRTGRIALVSKVATGCKTFRTPS